MDSGSKANATIVIPARNERESLRITIPMLGIVSKRVNEVIVVVDSENDESLSSIDIDGLSDLKIVKLLNSTTGVFGAITTGVDNATNELIVICVADELLPLLQLNSIFEKLDQGFDLVSVTRYAKGGRRHGGNRLEKALSRLGNLFIKLYFKGRVTDATTGMKAFRKSSWNIIKPRNASAGWASSLDIFLNANKNNFSYYEIPVVSVDRVMGGASNFRFSSWLPAYLSVLYRYFFQKNKMW